MKAITNRAEGEKPSLAVVFPVVRDHYRFFPHEVLNRSEINPMFCEVTLAFRFVPFVQSYLIVYTTVGNVNNNGAARSTGKFRNSPHLTGLKNLESLSRPMPQHVFYKALAQ